MITILDTSVVSEVKRTEPSAVVLKWLSQKGKEDGELGITTVSMAEILYGIEFLPQGKRRGTTCGCRDDVCQVFAGRTIPFDEESARAFSATAISRRAQRRPIAELDA